MIGLGRLLAAGALLALAACATTPPEVSPPAGRTLAPNVPTIATPRVSWSDLPGWAAEDHLGALVAVRAACRVRPPRYPDACRDLAAEPPASDSEARRFFERWFVLQAEPEDGLLTAYYTPVYDARRTPEPPFTAPLRPAGDPTLATEDRAAIAAAPADDALAWLKPEELFFLQVQGSGVLQMDDGTRLNAAYAGSNGKGFVAIGRVMRDRGLLPDGRTSAGAISEWLADHRGPEADAVMDQDPRYVFFRLAPDDGASPQGAAGLPLPAGRAAAVDPAFHPMGELLFLDAADPRLSGAPSAYRRIVAALDTGSAIKGPARADLYLGQGADAGLRAGLVRHRLILYRLSPR
jgi:membrane-bound lytic murein transglycosylase A